MSFGHSRARAAALLIPMLLFMAACQTPEAAAPSDGDDKATEATPSDADTDSATGGRDSASDAAREEEAALPKAPPVDDNPQRFLGLTPVDLTAELGKPQLRRQESTAEIWQYRRQDCVLDVFLYEESDGFKVAYLEARDLSAEPVETRPCLRDLLLSRQRQVSS